MKRTKILIVTLVAVSSLALGARSASADHNNRHPKAAANCSENISKQYVNGQTGTLTGSLNDSKPISEALTNCDHFWNTP